MLALSLLLAVADDPAASLSKTMLPVYEREAAEYTMAVESAADKPLDLKKEPVFEWSNPTREGVQQGVLFVWLRDGRPGVLCSVFSEPEGRFKGRKVMHEFHALDPEKLLVSRAEGMNEWTPRAGLDRKELADAPAPAATPGTRLLQMKRLAQDFAGYETDSKGTRWELRLLTAPLYRYPEAKAGVIDGALFALVSTAGTDPEVLLVIEATAAGKWQYACGRFSDRSLYLQRKEKDVWSSVRGETNTFLHDPQHLFRVYPDKVVALDGRLLARVRATEKVWWGEFFPVKPK